LENKQLSEHTTKREFGSSLAETSNSTPAQEEEENGKDGHIHLAERTGLAA